MLDWTAYIAGIWAEILKGSIQNGQTIVEFAPGGTNKVGTALARIQWSGTLYVVEPESLALETTLNTYKQILPNCKLVPVLSTLSQLPLEHFDILLANHPIDDMIIGNALSANLFASFFNNHYEKPIDHTKILWNAFSVSEIAKFATLVVDEVREYAKRATFTFLSQYHSYFFKFNGFTKPDDIANEALRAIRENIGGKLIRNGQWLIA